MSWSALQTRPAGGWRIGCGCESNPNTSAPRNTSAARNALRLPRLSPDGDCCVEGAWTPPRRPSIPFNRPTFPRSRRWRGNASLSNNSPKTGIAELTANTDAALKHRFGRRGERRTPPPAADNGPGAAGAGRGRGGRRPKALAGDKAYSAGWVRDALKKRRNRAVIPHKSNEKAKPGIFPRDLYKGHDVIEYRFG